MGVEDGGLSTKSKEPIVTGSEVTIPLHVEELVVSRRKSAVAVVRVETVTRTKSQVVREALTRERVEVERVQVGRYVDGIPPTREEGDVTIMPVVEEVVVVERKLFLKEEVRIRRVRTTEQHEETVLLREQEAVVTRTPTGGQSRPAESTTEQMEPAP